MAQVPKEAAKVVQDQLETILADLESKVVISVPVRVEARKRIKKLADQGVTSGHHPKAVVGGVVYGIEKNRGMRSRSKEISEALGVRQESVSQKYRRLVFYLR